ncbi:hypothetical protein MBLNU459_g4172t1 [Dothideomycetes sp. NU459]
MDQSQHPPSPSNPGRRIATAFPPSRRASQQQAARAQTQAPQPEASQTSQTSSQTLQTPHVSQDIFEEVLRAVFAPNPVAAEDDPDYAHPEGLPQPPAREEYAQASARMAAYHEWLRAKANDVYQSEQRIEKHMSSYKTYDKERQAHRATDARHLADKIQLADEINQTKQELHDERASHEMIRTERNQREQELRDERVSHEMTKAELRQKEQDLRDERASHEKTIEALRRAIAQ